MTEKKINAKNGRKVLQKYARKKLQKIPEKKIIAKKHRKENYCKKMPEKSVAKMPKKKIVAKNTRKENYCKQSQKFSENAKNCHFVLNWEQTWDRTKWGDILKINWKE